MANQLHITNGDGLTDTIKQLNLGGETVVWREMLCEGPTVYELGSEEFIELRTNFLTSHYNITKDYYQTQFLEELYKLSKVNEFDEVVLWFEFDLFSHINMLAMISHLENLKLNVPVYLVCSKKLKGEAEFNPLSQLSLKDLNNHYVKRIHLNEDDLEMAALMWQLYNGENLQKLKLLIKKKTNFEYLSSCIRAHIERFPNSTTGINTLEKNILKLIDRNNISSKNQLLGYALEYQGYFGYGDSQMQRILDKLERFYKEENNQIQLTAEGTEALNGSRNFYQVLKNDEFFGGVKMYDFLYDSVSHNILKL